MFPRKGRETDNNMTQTPSQSGGQKDIPLGQVSETGFDPANQSLADALRRSFGILKLVMFVLVILYFFSGFFSVEQHEVGLVTRYGRIVGVGSTLDSAVQGPGWHWSWPYPFERWVKVAVNERELPVNFLFQLSDEERTGGIKGFRYDNLSPMRDDYLITGDVNIIHASLIVKYRVVDPVAYLMNVHPMPAQGANARSEEYLRQPEYSILARLARNAVIETAAAGEALDIRGKGQDRFLVAVGRRLSEKLKDLESRGESLGIAIDADTGILAPKAGGTTEAIMPPRQVQEVFDKVFASQNEKSGAITKALASAQQRLRETAGPGFQEVADLVDAEFETLLRLSEEKSRNAPDAAEVARLSAEVEKHAALVEAALDGASGEVQAIIKDAQIRRDQFVKEVAGDYDQFILLLPEYQRNPQIFMSRMRDETYSDALANKRVGKIFLPEPGAGGRIWLQIPRTSEGASLSADDKSDSAPKTNSARNMGKGGVVRAPARIGGP